VCMLISSLWMPDFNFFSTRQLRVVNMTFCGLTEVCETCINTNCWNMTSGFQYANVTMSRLCRINSDS
jgi:hypothetical protein